MLIEKVEETHDIWLCYQLDGKSLNSSLFSVKGEFYKGERIYNVQYKELYKIVKKD